MDERSIWIMGLSCYLGCGLIWVLWNSSSRMFQRSVAMSNAMKKPWITLIALVIGLFTWPIGLIGIFVLEVTKRKREEDE